MNSSDVVLLWHMHQPDYRDPETGIGTMPWVRLHAACSYRDMAQVLAEHGDIRATVNFVPSLCAQLEALGQGATDSYALACEKPAADLDPAEREFVVARFFSVHWGRQVEARPRFAELLHKRLAAATSQEAAASFSARDFTDLEVLFHLGWIGFAVRDEEPALAEIERKGAGFSEDDKRVVLGIVRAQAAKVLPAWRALAERGQVELASSPYFHPILPLLIDSDCARRAMPEARLPSRFAYPQDAREQLLRAKQSHERLFGRPPAGMWPPEGSVSPEAVALYREAGVRWLATDETVLFGSLGHSDRAALARPYRFAGVDLLFRDRILSDKVGFAYAHGTPEAGAQDFVARARAVVGLVGVFLDGENAWESYEGRGRPFLRTLYQTLASTPELRTLTVSEALERHAPAQELPRLHSGSWIDGRFAIWIGDPDKNRAWEALEKARARCGESKAALEHLLVAEGSDWFWWFGEPFYSAEDALFDRLFRARLTAAYRAAGLEPPGFLGTPIGHGVPKPARPPTRFITPRLDGLVTSFFEWEGAGHLQIPRGTVMGESVPLLRAIYYGFNRETLFLRLDPMPPELPDADPMAELRGKEVRVLLRAGERHLALGAAIDAVALPVIEQTAPVAQPLGRGEGFARLEIVELSASFASLGLLPKQRVELVVQLVSEGISLAQYPRDGYLVFDVPDENFEAENWSA